MKMGRRLRCSSVTYRFRYAPFYRQSGSDRLAGGPFDRTKIPRISGTGHKHGRSNDRWKGDVAGGKPRLGRSLTLPKLGC
jgi:hypothetical protein